MRIVVHGQQAFGKAVLEALIKRGENVIAAYVAPEKEGAKADPLKEAALAASLHVTQGRTGECGIVGTGIGTTFDVLPPLFEQLRRDSSVASLSASVNVLPEMGAPDAPVCRIAFAWREELEHGNALGWGRAANMRATLPSVNSLRRPARL